MREQWVYLERQLALFRVTGDDWHHWTAKIGRWRKALEGEMPEWIDAFMADWDDALARNKGDLKDCAECGQLIPTRGTDICGECHKELELL